MKKRAHGTLTKYYCKYSKGTTQQKSGATSLLMTQLPTLGQRHPMQHRFGVMLPCTYTSILSSTRPVWLGRNLVFCLDRAANPPGGCTSRSIDYTGGQGRTSNRSPAANGIVARGGLSGVFSQPFILFGLDRNCDGLNGADRTNSFLAAFTPPWPEGGF